MIEGLWLGTWARFILGQRLGPFVPTPPHVASRLLRLAGLNRGDVLVDLGCGDGRVVSAAVKAGAKKAVGYEIDSRLVEAARENVKALGAAAEIRQQDALTADLSDADVVVLYLSETGNGKLLPGLERSLAAGSRVVSFTFPVPGREPSQTAVVDGITLYLYDVALAPDGTVHLGARRDG